MGWQTYTPEGQNDTEFFDRGAGVFSIRLNNWKRFALWKETYTFPTSDAVRISAESDAPAMVGNRAGVVIAFMTEENTIFSEEYLEPEVAADGTLKFSGTYDREEGVTKIEVRLYFKWMEGEVTFRNVKVEGAAKSVPRIAKLVTTCLTTQYGNEDLAIRKQRVNALLEKIEKEVTAPDLILFTEDVFDLGLGYPVKDISQSVPGEHTEFMSRWAVRLNCNIAFGMNETEDGSYYNACVIIDRQGKIAGKYHKTHLTWGESTRGVIPGDEYPVFDLDFGKVGVAICWDNWYGECARQLRMNGAELMVVPIAGCGVSHHRDQVWAARACEQGMAAMFAPQNASENGIISGIIYDTMGEVAACTHEPESYACGEVDLAKRCRTRYLSFSSRGEGRSLYIRERRNDLFSCAPDGKKIIR